MKKPVPFGQYQLLEPIRGGGMSEVWRARPENGSAVVAIKRVLPQFAQDSEILGMFLDEAKVAVQLSHPNIARIYDLGRVGDDLFMAMEYVAGSDLRAIFKRAAAQGSLMPIPLAVFVVSKLCDALDHAHRRTDSSGVPMQIVHRDVAPDNCLVTFDGAVKLIDFGVAKAAIQSSKTRVGVLKGKLSYMSPEQVAGLPVDRRSDVFSLGVVLYEMVTGRRLFWRESPLAILEAVRGAPVEAPSKVNPKVPPALERAILRALQKHREQRFEWASEMGAALRECLAGLPTPPREAHLRKYMSLMFVDELQAERDRRTEWAQAHVPGRVRGLGEPLEGGPEDEAERDKTPTLMERALKRPVGPPPAPAGALARAAPSPAPRRPSLEDPDDFEDADIELEDRPTLMPHQLPDMAVPDQLLDPGEDLPPPMPSPERPTVALQVFVEEGRRGTTEPSVASRLADRRSGSMPAPSASSSSANRRSGAMPAPAGSSTSSPGANRRSGSMPAPATGRKPVKKPT